MAKVIFLSKNMGTISPYYPFPNETDRRMLEKNSSTTSRSPLWHIQVLAETIY